MNRLKRYTPSPSMIVAVVALFVALGGAAYAGVMLSNNTVRSSTIVNGQVKTADLASLAVTNAKLNNNAVNAVKVRNGSLTGLDVADGSVGAADLGAGSVTPAKISGVPTVRAFHNANQSIPGNAAFTTVLLNSERFDTASMHRTDVDTSRLTIATPGIYLLTANVTWESNGTGAREVNIRKNGTALIARVVQPGDAAANTTDQSATTVAKLAAGDFVEVVVRQNSGAALNILAAPEFSPEFSATWIAPA